MLQHIEKKPGCIQAALQIIGDKWTALVLRELYSGPKRFCQLQSALSGMSPRTLTQRLGKLESHGVLTKKVCPRAMQYEEYVLTKKGSDFAGILNQMAAWGEKYHT